MAPLRLLHTAFHTAIRFNASMQTRRQHNVLKLISNKLEPAGLTETVYLFDHAQSQKFVGRPAVLGLFNAIFSIAFPDARIKISTFVADKSAAAVEFKIIGCHLGQFMGIPASGRELILAMTLVCQLENGIIRAATLYYDAGALLRQIGLAK